MKIYLAPEVASGLGEDTFWTWFKREVPESEFLTPESKISYKDVILQYSTVGKSKYPNNTICLLWELYPEMKVQLESDIWNDRIEKINESIKTAKKMTVTSEIMVEYYKDAGKIDVLPIGVDTDVFKPLKNKAELRKKYGIPVKGKIGVWAGTTHEMKGFDKFLEYKKQHSEIFWIIIWKWAQEAAPIQDPKCKNFIQIPQQQMNELFNCGDFFLSTSRLRPFYMTEWEALASNLPFIILDNIQKDFNPSNNPREQVMALGWDRKTTKEKWLKYINAFSQEKTSLDYIKFQANYIKDIKFTLPLKRILKKLFLLHPIYRKAQSIENRLNEINTQNIAQINSLIAIQTELDKKISEIQKSNNK